jgi:hypothetical protein
MSILPHPLRLPCLLSRRTALASVLALLATAGCEDSSTGPSRAPLVASVRFARDTIVGQDTVSVVLTARNATSAPVTIESEGACLLTLVIRAAPPYTNVFLRGTDGAARSCAHTASVSIAPGDSVVENAVLEVVTFTDAHSAQPGRPGEYLVIPVLNNGPDVLPAATANAGLLIVQ